MESTKGAAMSGIVDNPFVVFAAFLVAQWIAAYLGDFVRSRWRPAKKDELADLDVVQTAALTLLDAHHRLQLLDGCFALRSTKRLRGGGG